MMKKIFALLCICSLTLAVLTGCASDSDSSSSSDASGYDDYPSETINIVVPWAPGGGQDLLARAVQSALGEMGYTVVVTNIEGSSGGIGAMEVFHADPDGYTMLCNNNEAMYAYYLGGVNEVSPTEFTQLSTMVYDGNAICVPPDSPFKTFDDLVNYAKQNPGELQWGASGTNGFNHIASAMVWNAAGIEVNYVPFDGGAKVRTAGMGGQVDVILCQSSEVKSSIEGGDLLCLATTTSEPVSFMPDVPTCSELGYDVVVGVNRGFFGPAGMDPALVDRIAGILKDAYDSEGFTDNLEETMGFNPVYMSPEEASALLDSTSVEIEELYNSLVG